MSKKQQYVKREFFTDDPDPKVFFRFDKLMVQDLRWGDLPPSAKAVLPVIAVHANEEGICHPSQLLIAALAGVTLMTARKGIEALAEFGIIGMRKYQKAKGGFFYAYRIQMAPWEKGRVLILHKALVTGGNWAMLSPAAKALYIGARGISSVLPTKVGGEGYVHDTYTVGEESWEYFSESGRRLKAFANISYRSIPPAIDSLVGAGLLREVPKDTDEFDKVDICLNYYLKHKLWAIARIPDQTFNHNELANIRYRERMT